MRDTTYIYVYLLIPPEYPKVSCIGPYIQPGFYHKTLYSWKPPALGLPAATHSPNNKLTYNVAIICLPALV